MRSKDNIGIIGIGGKLRKHGRDTWEGKGGTDSTVWDEKEHKRLNRIGRLRRDRRETWTEYEREGSCPHRVKPLKEGVGSLVRGGVTGLGVVVPLVALHVREHVLRSLLGGRLGHAGVSVNVCVCVCVLYLK